MVAVAGYRGTSAQEKSEMPAGAAPYVTVIPRKVFDGAGIWPGQTDRQTFIDISTDHRGYYTPNCQAVEGGGICIHTFMLTTLTLQWRWPCLVLARSQVSLNPRPDGPLDFPPPAGGGGGVWTPHRLSRLLRIVKQDGKWRSKAREKSFRNHFGHFLAQGAFHDKSVHFVKKLTPSSLRIVWKLVHGVLLGSEDDCYNFRPLRAKLFELSWKTVFGFHVVGVTLAGSNS